MQLAIHLGAHSTDEDVLLKTLYSNRPVLAEAGIVVPPRRRYATFLRETYERLDGDAPGPEVSKLIREKIMATDDSKRIILSSDRFLSEFTTVFDEGMIYQAAGANSASLAALFPEDEVSFFLATRNPASFIPAVFRHPAQQQPDFGTYMDGTDIRDIRWSDVILAIRETNATCPITVWCNEDTPIIWPEVIRAVTGLPPEAELEGDHGVAQGIMRREGFARMLDYLAGHPPQTALQRRRIVQAFLDKFVLPEALEEELDAPGWTDDLVQELSESYEEDLYEIQRMAGVTFIQP